jgi:translation initiation factor IF-2
MSRKTESAQNVIAALLGASSLALLLALVSVATRALGPAVPGASLIPPRALAPAVGRAASAPALSLGTELLAPRATLLSPAAPAAPRVLAARVTRPVGAPPLGASSAPSAPAQASPPQAGPPAPSSGGDAGGSPSQEPAAQQPNDKSSPDETSTSKGHDASKKTDGPNGGGGSPQGKDKTGSRDPDTAQPAATNDGGTEPSSGPHEPSTGGGESGPRGGGPDGPGPGGKSH